MINRRPPSSLKELAFSSWLIALDSGSTIPAVAPPIFLSRALKGAAKLKESTVVRIAQEAAASGVDELVVNEELFNPACLRRLTESLITHCSNIRKLVLQLSCRITCAETNLLLADALKGMVNLQEISLNGGANDDLMRALAVANPPLTHVDISCSPVTDKGIEALLNINNKSLKSECLENGTLANLQTLNIWETQITSKGCMMVLKYCQSLISLTSQWTAEALVLLDLKGCNPVRLEQLSANREELSNNLIYTITNICPCLKSLIIRRPKEATINLEEIFKQLHDLEEFSLLQFYPLCNSQLRIPFMAKLRQLNLSSLGSPDIYVDDLAINCPLLIELSLDGLNIKVRQKLLSNSPSLDFDNLKKFENLRELRLLSTYIPFTPLNPEVTTFIISNLISNLRLLHLDMCEMFSEQDFVSLFDGEALNQIEDIRLTRACNLTEKGIHLLTRNCPLLERLILTFLPKNKKDELENVKCYLKNNNVNLKIITYTNRSFDEIVRYDPSTAPIV